MSDRQTGEPGPQEQKAAHTPDKIGPVALDLVATKLTDVGRARPHNEDYVDYYTPPDPRQLARKGSIYVVADGMGGHQAGEVASQGAVELAIGQYYSDTTHDVGTGLVRAFRAANQQIHAQAQSDPSKGGMGTTLVAAVILGRKVYVANVGDSRAYLVNRQGITQITEDHSWVEEQVRAGLLTPEQAKRHPQRNLVTRALGSKPAVEVDQAGSKIMNWPPWCKSTPRTRQPSFWSTWPTSGAATTTSPC
jgi:serine/threonine protein phosphatase PrpC